MKIVVKPIEVIFVRNTKSSIAPLLSTQIELLRNKLEKLIEVTESLIDSEVISLSQELDKLILRYYLSIN
ncbi:MAG: aspartyl-phosphate phosphatase Spo0E family protein [Clostridium sp.]|uniref:aspartyl-phosphate phosphatase Spo0E family protein n=1 Tax=Clostridium sp. TaxID=1506 RepID=UPI003D6D5E3E